MIALDQRRENTTLFLKLTGCWVFAETNQIKTALNAVSLSGVEQLRIDATQLDGLDVTAAWLLHQQVLDWQTQVWVEVNGFPQEFLVYFVGSEQKSTAVKTSWWRRRITAVGKQVMGLFSQFGSATTFLGRTTTSLLSALLNPRLLRFRSLFHHVFATGISAIPITAMVACLISIVITYQGGGQLKALGAAIFTVDMVAVSVLRELGVLLTSIMVAGRSGSAFAAEIGLMKTNQEIDALQVMGNDPFMVLVLPRVLALMLVLPLLTLLANMIALGSAALISPWLLDISVAQFFARVESSVQFETFAAGLIKAPFFALGIALVGCRQGMLVSGSSESLGEHTTRAVVESISLVLLLDAVFSILFYRLGF